MERNREQMTVRGLSNNHNKDLKSLFGSSAIPVSAQVLTPCAANRKQNYGDPTARVELEDLRLG